MPNSNDHSETLPSSRSWLWTIVVGIATLVVAGILLIMPAQMVFLLGTSTVDRAIQVMVMIGVCVVASIVVAVANAYLYRQRQTLIIPRFVLIMLIISFCSFWGFRILLQYKVFDMSIKAERSIMPYTHSPEEFK